MYNLSKEFYEFYTNYTILPETIQSELRCKKKYNIDRLKSGLHELNEENKTHYCVLDTKEQGSIAMSTVVQNNRDDYDIDVAIIFEENNIGENTGTTTIKRIVANALKKKCTNFKKEPESLTNCVRIEYSEGYHIDFAIYKKIDNDTYYHAGSSWRKRDPMSINNWFKEQINKKGNKLRSIVRLSKMFCKSRSSWKMPGGLIQSVLCCECFVERERLDECFYETMKKILQRLTYSIEVYNPTDTTISLLLKEQDKNKMNNWKQRLNDKLNKLEIILKSNCTAKQAYDSWYSFFNHDFWKYDDQISNNNSYANVFKEYKKTETEEFISDKYDLDIKYYVDIECDVESNGFRPQLLSYILKFEKWLPLSKTLTFYCQTNTPKPYDVLWKIRNVGVEAERRNMIRGEIIKSNVSNNKRREYTNFSGPHFVECYVIKNGICVATGRIDVPIKV